MAEISLIALQKQFTGSKFGELVLHHLDSQSEPDRLLAINGLIGGLHPELKEISLDFLTTIVDGFARVKDFWTIDCGEALKLYTTATKTEAKKHGIIIDDDYAFNYFNLIVLTLAHKVYSDRSYLRIVKKSLRLFPYIFG